MSDYPKFYTFSLNRRVYPKDKSVSSGPIYAEHFQEIPIVGETDKEFTVEGGGVINKRSMKYAPASWSKERLTTYTAEVREAMIWMHKRYSLMKKVERVQDAALLQHIAALVGYEWENK